MVATLEPHNLAFSNGFKYKNYTVSLVSFCAIKYINTAFDGCEQ